MRDTKILPGAVVEVSSGAKAVAPGEGVGVGRGSCMVVFMELLIKDYSL